ncbi:prephenate dehydrogenase [Bifidobacterium psychraerophilum DSM 22366]|uniref:Prephenate dehydrogenase n=2 Tax=Bifidobacterium psychraerophilum TaxID=218140 RepID=A0A087CDW4_9BIFI|nr:prephenate dehydrogenase [Bifidobacterium psychraerophilum]PKA95808.1 prephenate dehydrogenase [Bifidobacterium psychraerophilum DSM 22366]
MVTAMPDSHASGMMHPLKGAEASPILTSAHKIAIAGLGLIGGSLARRLVERGRFVIAWNHNDRPYKEATKAGIHCVDSLQDLVTGKPDVLVLATPLVTIPGILKELAPSWHPSITLSDVGSVKGEVREQVNAAGLGEYYVGAHPMAGNECSGFEASSSGLLDQALWAVTVDEQTAYSRFLTVADMICKGADNALIALDDGTHDACAALISHMPHVVSTALSNELVDSADRNIAVALSAGSWRDMTRVSLTDPMRTRAMVEEDSRNVEALLRSVAQRLTNVADALHDGDEAAITRFFAQADPFRVFKANQRDGGDAENRDRESDGASDSILLDDASWREELLQSARRGERITAFLTTHEARIMTRAMS